MESNFPFAVIDNKLAVFILLWVAVDSEDDGIFHDAIVIFGDGDHFLRDISGCD